MNYTKKVFDLKTVLIYAIRAMEDDAATMQENILHAERFGDQAIKGGHVANRIAQYKDRYESHMQMMAEAKAGLKKLHDSQDGAFVESFKEWLRSEPFK